MTEIEFAQRCARMAAQAASWAGDTLYTRDEDAGKSIDRAAAERFIRQMRDRLDYIEEKLNG